MINKFEFESNIDHNNSRWGIIFVYTSSSDDDEPLNMPPQQNEYSETTYSQKLRDEVASIRAAIWSIERSIKQLESRRERIVTANAPQGTKLKT